MNYPKRRLKPPRLAWHDLRCRATEVRAQEEQDASSADYGCRRGHRPLAARNFARHLSGFATLRSRPACGSASRRGDRLRRPRRYGRRRAHRRRSRRHRSFGRPFGGGRVAGHSRIEHRRHIQPVRGSATSRGQAHHRRHQQPCGRLLSARPEDRPPGGTAPGQPLRRQQGLCRGARQPLCRQARDRISVHSDRQFRDATDRQTPAVDLDQPARLHPARAHRPRASRHPLRDRLRRLEQSAVLVRQLQRRAARLPAAGRFRALCRGGARRPSLPAPTRSPSAIRAEPSAPPSTRPKPLRIRAPRAPLPAAARARPSAPRPRSAARR